MPGMLENFLRSNWFKISDGGDCSSNISIVKLSGQLSERATLNFLVFLRGEAKPRFFIKMNRKPGDWHSLDLEYANLKYFKEKLPAGIARAIPRSLLIGHVDDSTVALVENFLDGNKYDITRGLGMEGLFISAFDWLKEFHLATKVKQEVFSGDSYKKKLTQGLEKISVGADILELGKRLSERSRVYDKCILPVTARQGDFDFDNILAFKKGIHVLDWEDSLRESLPFLDLEFLIFHCALYSKLGSTPIESFSRFFDTGSLGLKLVNRFLESYCQVLNIKKEVFYLQSLLDILEIIDKGYGGHSKVPLQDKTLVRPLIELALREVS